MLLQRASLIWWLDQCPGRAEAALVPDTAGASQGGTAPGRAGSRLALVPRRAGCVCKASPRLLLAAEPQAGADLERPGGLSIGKVWRGPQAAASLTGKDGSLAANCFPHIIEKLRVLLHGAAAGQGTSSCAVQHMVHDCHCAADRAVMGLEGQSWDAPCSTSLCTHTIILSPAPRGCSRGGANPLRHAVRMGATALAIGEGRSPSGV